MIGYGADLNYVDNRNLTYRLPIYGLLSYFDEMTMTYDKNDLYIVRTADETLVEIEKLFQNGLFVSLSPYPIISFILHNIDKKIRYSESRLNSYTKLLKLVLEYGANPNIEKGSYHYNQRSIIITILLVLYGYHFNENEISGIIEHATNIGSYDVVNFFTHYSDHKIPPICN